MSGGLIDAAPSIGVIMACVAALAAVVCIFANEYFKGHGLPGDEGDDL